VGDDFVDGPFLMLYLDILGEGVSITITFVVDKIKNCKLASFVNAMLQITHFFE